MGRRLHIILFNNNTVLHILGLTKTLTKKFTEILKVFLLFNFFIYKKILILTYILNIYVRLNS